MSSIFFALIPYFRGRAIETLALCLMGLLRHSAPSVLTSVIVHPSVGFLSPWNIFIISEIWEFVKGFFKFFQTFLPLENFFPSPDIYSISEFFL